MPATDNPSHHEANKMLRVLNGKRLKYTVRVSLPDGKVVEFQSDDKLQTKWNEDDRHLWLMHVDSGYNNVPCMRWIEGAILLIEENPKE